MLYVSSCCVFSGRLMCNTHTYHYSLRIFLSACCAMWAQLMHIQCTFNLDAHWKHITTSFMWKHLHCKSLFSSIGIVLSLIMHVVVIRQFEVTCDLSTFISMCVHTCVCVCVCVCACTCMCVCVYMYVHMYVCVCFAIYTCEYMHVLTIHSFFNMQFQLFLGPFLDVKLVRARYTCTSWKLALCT